jgi:hypothetical protein
MTKTVSDFIIEQLAVWNVKYIFGLPGTSALGLVEAVRKSNRLQFIQVRHEETAALAASAYSKLTGEIGVCLSIAGPGATNLITGLFDAKMDKTPVIALTGQVKRTFIGPGTFQEIDQEALFNPVAVFNKTICTREQSKELTSLVIKYAYTCQGVAHLAVPNDVQKEEWTEQPVPKENFIPLTRILPDKEVILEAQRLLTKAQAPVIIAGFGAREARKEVLALSEKINAPVVTTFRAKGLISEIHPYSLGVLGKTGSPVARKIVQRADLLIVIGSSFSEQTSIPLDKDIVQIDLNPIHLSKITPVKLLVPGIEFSADKLLQGRTFSYADTQRYRLGTNYLQLPINHPLVPVNNNQRDGAMQHGSFTGPVNYEPGSLADETPKEAPAGVSYAPQIEGKATRTKIGLTNDFEQAGERYRSFSKVDREHLVDNLIADLMHIDKQIQRRVIENLTKADVDLGKHVANDLKF